jgi:exodeoxyribonuclease VII large subunit
MIEDTQPNQNNIASPERKIYSVSELNAKIKFMVEDSFPFVWIFGEISNFRLPASGHFYFTIKDDASQINAVMFRGQQRQLKFEPADGMSITGMGRLSVYEPRGTYQIILEYLEPSGIGALQIAYEKLKKRLAAEGCFDDKFKKPLPFLPETISIITSPSGAVVHDILNIINHRFPNLYIQIMPTKVQGRGAADEIVAALGLLNKRQQADVAILARGGGSLEDLHAFNSEAVARAIFTSEIPIISAIGHETDYTISDFVADRRAPTPSAAAALVVPEKSELERRCQEALMHLRTRWLYYFERLWLRLNELSERLIDPRRKFGDYRLRLDDLFTRLYRVLILRIRREREYLAFWEDRLGANNPSLLLVKSKEKLKQTNDNLFRSLSIYNNMKQIIIRELTAKLEAMSPLAILARGYSVTRTIPDAAIVKDSQDVALDQDLEVLLDKGRLFCQIKGKATDGKKNI